VTSVRDFVVYGNDLIVATHGRGFWVMDDISALRQVTGEVLQVDAWLFKPADAINFVPGDDNGTPYQRDEAQAQNPPDGASIDFYLKAPAAVALEIVDSAGKVMRKWPPPEPVAATPTRGGLPRVSPLWQPAPEVFSTSAGMHRVVWRPVEPPAPATAGGGAGGGGPRRGGGARLTGTFTARLTINGRVSSQTFAVRPDPRSDAHQ